jgi:uncharacterized protein
MIPRAGSPFLGTLASQFPVVAITGPRQSGKTTLARAQFPSHPYVSLENLDTALRAREDPRGFLASYPQGAIIDEIQRVPSLLSYLQQIVDENPRPGTYVLTGSQQFGLLGAISQSLAGRVGLLELLPFSLDELFETYPDELRDSDQALWRGWYPPVFDRGLDPELWYSSYISTYLERDVRQIENIRDLAAFRRFLALCAGRTGQLVNLSAFAGDCGVSHNTIKAWLSVLEASYLVRLVQPYHHNFNKRLVKAPKLYFLDTGLAARLLGIRDASQLRTHPSRGALFETFVYGELLKRRLNGHSPWDIYFWRDQVGDEVDFILENGESFVAIEAKSGATFHPDHGKSLEKLRRVATPALKRAILVNGGVESFIYKDSQVLPWNAGQGWGLE